MFGLFREDRNFVRIPLEVKGALFVSPMPFGPYDRGNRLLKSYKKKGIEFAVVLVTEDEMERKGKRDLLAFYNKNGISPIHFPITDYTSPDLDDVSTLIDELDGHLADGARIAVHCNAGVGRTAVIAACIVQDIMKLSAQEAIDHIKAHMMVNMTGEQVRLVRRFNPLEQKLS